MVPVNPPVVPTHVDVPVMSRQVLIDQAEQGVDYFTIHAATLLRCVGGKALCRRVLGGLSHKQHRALNAPQCGRELMHCPTAQLLNCQILTATA